MKKNIIILAFLMVIPIMAIGATLNGITFSATSGRFDAELSFSGKPSWTSSGVLGNSPQISFDGTFSSTIDRKINWGPLNVTLSSTGNRGTISFDFPFIVSTFVNEKNDNLTVNFITLGISQSLALSGPATTISIDFSGETGSTLGLAIKYLARLLERNLVIDPSISNNPVNLTLKGVTPAEAFYDVLISSPGIGYAILPDGTYYIAKTSSLVNDLGKLRVGTYNNVVSFYDLSTTTVSSPVFKSLVENLFGQNTVIGSIGSYQIVKAPVEQQKTIESLMSFLKNSESFQTFSWNDPDSVPDLTNLVSMMYPTLRLMYLRSFSTLVVSGGKTDVQKVGEVISKYSEILSQKGPKITVSFSVPQSNVQAFLQFAKRYPEITTYGSQSSRASDSVYLVNGPTKQVNEFAGSVGLIASTITQTKPRTLHFNFSQWPSREAFGDLSEMLSVMYPDVRMVYLNSFGQILFYGTNAPNVDAAAGIAEKRAKELDLKVPHTTVTIQVSSGDLPTVNAMKNTMYPSLFGTSSYSTGGTYAVSKYVVSGPSSDVSAFVRSLENANLIQRKEISSQPTVSVREIPWADSNTSGDLEKLISIKFPTVKTLYLSNMKEFILYGTDGNAIEGADGLINAYSKSVSVKVPEITTVFTIETKNFETVRAVAESKGLSFYGPSKPSTASTTLSVAVSGPASAVGTTIETFKISGLAIPSKSSTTTQPSTRIQIVTFDGTKISCDVENYSLSSLVYRVYRHFGKNIVFAVKAVPDVTLKLSEVTLEQFDYALSNAYALTFTGTSMVIAEPNSRGITRTFHSSGNMDQIKSIASFVGGTVYTDPDTGVVIVSGLTPSSANKLDAMVKPLLAPRKDVKILAKIIDVTNSKNVTQSASATLMTPQLIFNNGLNFNLSLVDLADIQKLVSGLSDQLLSANASVTAKFSKTTGVGTVLSAPTLTTQSGESANIVVGSQYPYLVTSTDSNGGQTQQLKFLTTGIQLTILPIVLANGQISLTVTIEISDADWGHAVNGVPAVNTRSASMKVVVSNDQTLLIGGLTKQNRSENVTKIPFLGDLPFIGQFFTSTTFQDSNDNLDIVITASVVQ